MMTVLLRFLTQFAIRRLWKCNASKVSKVAKGVFRPLRTTAQMSHQAGQAVVEYVLLIAIALLIVGGAIYQFNDAFRSFATNYFGEYLSCLMETGELPNLGLPQDGSLCDTFFQPFSMANGRPAIEQLADTSNGNGPRDNGNSQEPSRSANDSSSSEEGRSDRIPIAKGAGEGAAGGPGSVRGPSRFQTSGGSSNDSQTVKRAKAGDSYTGSTERSMPGSLYSGDGRIPVNRDAEGLGGRFATLDDEKEKEKNRSQAKVEPKDSNRQDRKELIKIQRKTAALDDGAKEEEWGLGKFFRYLVIIALILALVIFLGGQALQISKSMD